VIPLQRVSIRSERPGSLQRRSSTSVFAAGAFSDTQTLKTEEPNGLPYPTGSVHNPVCLWRRWVGGVHESPYPDRFVVFVPREARGDSRGKGCGRPTSEHLGSGNGWPVHDQGVPPAKRLLPRTVAGGTNALTLHPDSDRPEFEPLVIQVAADEDGFSVVAEMLMVLPASA